MVVSKFICYLWLIFGVVGWCAFSFFDRSLYTFYDLGVSDYLMIESVFAHFVAAMSIYLGALLQVKLFPRKGVGLLRLLREDFNSTAGGGVAALTIFFTVTCVVTAFIAYGPVGLFYRTFYISEVGAASIISQMTSMMAVVLSAILHCRSDRRSVSIARVCFFLVFFSIFAKGSRLAVIAFAAFFVLPLIFRGHKLNFRLFLKIFIIFTISFFLMHGMLYFRDDSQYGLIPYLEKFSEIRDSVSDNDYASLWGIFFNVTFSIPVTQATIESGVHNIYNLFVAINPLPGDFAGWYDISDSRRISIEIPYSAFGELYGVHSLILAFYMLFVGFMFGAFEQELISAKFGRRWILLLLYFSFGLLFSLFCMQYNLRASTRMIYYLIVIFLINRLFTFRLFYKF